MDAFKRILNHPYSFWAVLCLPALPMSFGLATSNDPKIFESLLHPTGEFSARFMIIAMMLTPLAMLCPSWRAPRWLLQRRRYVGVAAFLYAVVHTVFYLIDRGDAAISQSELFRIYIWSGWIAFFLFVPLAVSSTDGWIRRLGPKWKSLQRLVYGAAVLTLLHWAALRNWDGIMPAVIHFGPLLVLQACRVVRLYRSSWSLDQHKSEIDPV